MRAVAACFVALLSIALLPFAAHCQETPVHIGLLLDSLKDERWQRDCKLLQARAREIGAKITVKDAEGDDALQLPAPLSRNRHARVILPQRQSSKSLPDSGEMLCPHFARPTNS